MSVRYFQMRWIEINGRVFNLGQTTHFKTWKRTRQNSEEYYSVSALLTSFCGDIDAVSPDDVHIGEFPTKDEAKQAIRDIIAGEYDMKAAGLLINLPDAYR